MRGILTSKISVVALVFAIAILITGLTLAATNASPGSSPSGQLTSPVGVVEIEAMPNPVVQGRSVEIAGSGFSPGELVLFQVIINDVTGENFIIDAGTANDAGAFLTLPSDLPVSLLPGVYTIRARTIDDALRASAPLVICAEGAAGKCE